MRLAVKWALLGKWNAAHELLRDLKERGVTPEQMSALMDDLAIELVLTAHPTQTRRRTILSKVQRTAKLLGDLKQKDLLPREREELIQSLYAEIAVTDHKVVIAVDHRADY